MATNNLLNSSDYIEPRLPPFLFTYWNPFSKDSHLLTSWFDYVKDVTVVRYAADSVGRYIQQTSAEQIDALYNVGNAICGQVSDLQHGISEVQYGIAHLQVQLDRVGDLVEGVNHRLDLVVDAVRTNNILQENVAELLRIPESQKQRQHHVEMGLKFLQHALKDNDLYSDALHELLEAEKLMPYDYFVLHRIGMIYLYVPDLGDLTKALEYFTRAGKYAAVESDPGAVRLNNILTKRIGKSFNDQMQSSAKDVSELAAESYLQAATALYALGEFPKAVAMSEKAVKYNPAQAKHWFFLAKYLTRAGEVDAAAPTLQKAVELVPAMALAALGDFDLNSCPTILQLLTHLDTQAKADIEGIVEVIRKSLQNRYPKEEVSQLISEVRRVAVSGNYPDKTLLISQALLKYEQLVFWTVTLSEHENQAINCQIWSLQQLQIPFSYADAHFHLADILKNGMGPLDAYYYGKYPIFRLDKLKDLEPNVRSFIDRKLQTTTLGRILLTTSRYLIKLNRYNLDLSKAQAFWIPYCECVLLGLIREKQPTSIRPSFLRSAFESANFPLQGGVRGISDTDFSFIIHYLEVVGVLSTSEGDNPRDILVNESFLLGPGLQIPR